MKQRLTELRKVILRIIDEAEKPLNAKILKKRIRLQPNVSTIYRALDFLEKNRFINSVSFSGVKFYFTSKRGDGHFLICQECHEILKFGGCVAGGIRKRIQEKYDYRITDHVLYFKGICPECQSHLDKKTRVMS
jgi:Fur family ferric uptake transcriptional regulator